jgi:hypothetical protein
VFSLFWTIGWLLLLSLGSGLLLASTPQSLDFLIDDLGILVVFPPDGLLLPLL